jgi:Spy/CpxP family protein refolding chaperone
MNPIVKRYLMVAAILAAIAGVSANATAQGSNHPTGQHTQRMEHMHKRHTDQQIQLKSTLKITASQEAAWNTYVTSTAPYASANPRGLAKDDLSTMTTPQRMDHMQAMRAAHDAVMTKRIEAVKALYAALTPEQQKVFDTQTRGGFHRTGMKGEHRMDGKGGHGERDLHRGMGCDGPGAKRS